MTFTQALDHEPVMLTEGAVIERLRRTPGVHLDPHVLNAALLYDAAGAARLAAIYRQYMEVGRNASLPMLIGAPTWRANPERMRLAGLDNHDVNADAVHFMQTLRSTCGAYAHRVFIGGLMAGRADAYRPAQALSAAEALRFHHPQATALAAAGPDFILAATLPALSETLGLAQAVAQTGVPYVLSFVLRSTGRLLDGTPIEAAIQQIDHAVQPRPACYWANCTHPRVFIAAIKQARARLSAPHSSPGRGGLAASVPPAHVSTHTLTRLIGLQGNTSTLSPEELDERSALDSEAPDRFAAAMLAARQQCGLRILGGCCGTDATHLRAIANALAAERTEAGGSAP